MRPFELPDFYRPWPPRLNPHVEEARAHNRAWAARHGLIDEGTWDAATADSIDLALFAAYCFPDATPARLDLLTDWYFWGFYFDDWFLRHYKSSGDVAGAAAWLAEVRAFMPADLARPVPEAADPVQATLAELWARTVPGTTEEWRRRFGDNTFAQMDDAFWELGNLAAGRVPNPIDYLERRRGAGAGRWVADLIELVNGTPLPDHVWASRPVQVMRDTFTDAQVLLNDVFSYQRETEHEGELNNFVLVLREFLGMTPQEAADATNDLLTSRLLQFESTLLTELPDLPLTPAERVAVLNVARSLQDANAGSHEWHLRSSRYMNEATRGADPKVPVWRYPTGLGTSAARLWGSHRPVDRRASFTLPPEEKPARSPFAGGTRTAAADWARRMGLPYSPQAVSWAVTAHNGVSRDRLEVLSQWYVLLAAVDTTVDRLFKARGDVAGGRAFLRRLPLFLTETGHRPVNAVERGLADLWGRAPLDAAHFEQLLETREWELGNSARGRVPDPVDHLQTRRAEHAGLMVDLVLYGLGFPPAERTALEECFADIATARRDLVTYKERIALPTEVSNGVLALQRLLECDLQLAADVVGDLLTARRAQFDRLAADAPEDYAEALRTWLGGDLGERTRLGMSGLGTRGAHAWRPA
ncbi:terpene synthase family protein [Herbidospora sp. RD11066]